MWRVTHGELDEVRVKVVVLAVGTHNNHAAVEIFKAILAILNVIKQKQPESHIIVMVSVLFNIHSLTQIERFFNRRGFK